MIMCDVNIRNVEKNIKIFEAITCIYSRIVLRKLSHESLKIYRKIERATNQSIKLNVDILFLNNIIIIIKTLTGRQQKKEKYCKSTPK